MPIWSEFVESSLDIIRQNTSKLAKVYKEKYDSLKRNVWLTTTVPVTMLSVYSVLYNFNVNDIEDQTHAKVANQVTSVFLVVYTLSHATGFDFSATLDKYATIARTYDTTSKTIESDMKEETK